MCLLFRKLKNIQVMFWVSLAKLTAGDTPICLSSRDLKLTVALTGEVFSFLKYYI